MIGRVLNETYALERRIGSGGMGRVYAGTHLRLSRPVAIKVLLSKFASNPDAVERFRHEARSASALGHPNIVQVYDFNQSEDSHWYIVMEFLVGEDLRGLLKREGRLEPRACLGILRQTCDALDLAHSKGLIHRDLKPSNIFLRESSAARRDVRILDFGVAKVLGADLGLTMDGALLGTPHYMAPEQAAGGGALTRRVDTYALGTVLFEMLTGRRPFEAETPLSILHLRATRDAPKPSSVVTSLPEEIDEVVTRALAREPGERFESTMELALSFERALAAAGVDTSTAPVTESSSSGVEDPASMEADTLLVEGAAPNSESLADVPSSIVRLQESDELRMATIVVVAVGAAMPEEEEEEDLDEILEQTGNLLERLADEVENRGGVVQQQLGDSLTAVFGVPSATGDDPVRAVRAALAARDRGKDFEDRGVEVRVGVHTGRVLTRKKRSGVTGEVVKTATRLADECPGGEVLVGHATYVHIRGRFDLSFRDRIKLRGSREPLRTYRVTDERDHGVVLEAGGPAGGDAPLVGREAERAYLWGLFRRAVDERVAQVVLLLGGPGSGKTRMAHEFAAALEEHSERVSYFPAQAGELAEESPYGLLAEVIRVKTGSSRAMTLEEAGARLYELVRWPFTIATQSGTVTAAPAAARGAPDPSEIAGAIGAAIGVPVAGGAPKTAAGPRAQQEKLANALRTYLEALAQKEPVVLVLDDLHRADDESLDLLELTLRGLEDQPVFMLAVARPDLLDHRPNLLGGFEHLSQIQLRNLSSTAVTALVGALLGGPAPAGLGGAIHKRSGGNPHVVEEMVHALRDGDQLKEAATGEWVFLGDVASLDIPGRAEALLQARLDQLPATERDVLRAAAVTGPVFWEDVLTHLGIEGVESRLETLAQAGMIHLRPVSRFPTTRQWAFKSELMCDVARGNLPARDRRQIHLAVADWLARQGGRDDPDTLSLRAHHLTLGGDRPEAIKRLSDAGEIAEKQHRWQVALGAYERAFGLAEAEKDRPTAQSLAASAGRLAVRAYAPARGVPILERGIDLAGLAGDDKTKANLLQLLGRALAIHGDAAKAREVTELAAELAEQLDDLRLRFEAGKALGFVLYYSDDFGDAAVAFERCIQMARELEDKAEVALNLYNVADCSLNAGAWERALQFADKATAAADNLEEVSFIQHSAAGISAFVRARHMGDATARVELEQWAAFADEQGYVDQQLDARLYLVEVFEHAGDIDSATAVAQAYIEVARSADSAQAERKMQEILARLQSHRADAG